MSVTIALTIHRSKHLCKRKKPEIDGPFRIDLLVDGS